MIVACTGHTEDLYIKKAWRYQMDEVLPKPTNVKALKAVLDEIIELKDDSSPLNSPLLVANADLRRKIENKSVQNCLTGRRAREGENRL